MVFIEPMLCWRAFSLVNLGVLLLGVTWFLAVPVSVKHDQGRRLKNFIADAALPNREQVGANALQARETRVIRNLSPQLQFSNLSSSSKDLNDTNIIPFLRRAGALREAMPETAPYFVRRGDGGVMADGRLCIRGKLVPNLYVLGTEKCGTSTMFNVLHDEQGVESVAEIAPRHGKSEGIKEWHWFDNHWHRTDPEWDLDEVAESWYGDLPDCSAQHAAPVPRKRFVFGDFTPASIRLVPLPTGFSKGRYFERYDVDKINLPATFRHLYGPFAHHLHFIHLIREPVSQMRSRWYFKTRPKKEAKRLAKKADSLGWKGARMGSFPADVTLALDEFAEGRITILLWCVLYARHLQAWMTHFPAKQFIPIPFRYFTYMKRDQVCNMIGQRVGMEMQCSTGERSSQSVEHEQEQHGLYPPLQARVDAALAGEFALLIDVLHRANQEGAGLVGLTPVASKEDVKQWVLTGW